MSSESEYVTDVRYVRRFDDDLSPSNIRLVAALNGFPTSPGGSFDYCELGCGSGDTAVVLAASNPQARFIGVDLNPEHIAVAKRLASGGVDNVRFLERDFETLANEKIPELDFICAHGVLSWVGPAKRKAVLDFASAKLKPGGLLYVSYNAMPGWASVEPLRQLLVSRTLGAEGDTLARARVALEFAKQMHEGGAEYFTHNPSATQMLATMEAQGLSYVAHEYLNAHWAPMYFAHVAWEMASNHLHFVGQLPLYLNYRDLSIPPRLAALFENVVDRATFESLKDFALNEFFRRDIYVKGNPGRSAASTDAYFDSTPFGLLSAPPTEREVRLPHATLRFDGPVFDALFDALGQGASTGKELGARPSLAAFSPSQVRKALLRTVLGGHVMPMTHVTRAEDHVALDRALRIPLQYNRAVLERPFANDSPLVLASPACGTGVAINALEALALRVITQVPEATRRDEWVRELLGKMKLRMNVRGQSIVGLEEQTAVVLAEVDAFRRNRLVKFIELGIVEPST